MLKLVGLSMMIATQTGRVGWLRDRTPPFPHGALLGRWSMIDIFMESLPGAPVVLGSVITIEPGGGAVAFCGVVILTMFAAEPFRSATDVGRRGEAHAARRRGGYARQSRARVW
jgi:paraquat-inducible protein A